MGPKKGIVVITGASSFIGCHVALQMTQDFSRVIGTVTKGIKDYIGIRKKRLELLMDCGVQIMTLDLLEQDGLKEFVQRIKPEVWVHHAGWVENYATFDYDFDKGYQINISPLSRLYPLLKEEGCHGVVVTGSCSEYSESKTALCEDDACWPATAYGLSKLTETIRAMQLANQYGLKTRVARIFLPFGQLDTPGKLIADAANSLKRGIPIELTACEQYRDFIYIKDVATAYQALISNLQSHAIFDIFNICSGQGTRLRDILLEMTEVLGSNPNLLLFGKKYMRAGEGKYCFGSNQKSLELLQWKPRPWKIGIRDYLNHTSL